MTKIELPHISERIRGISLPEDGVMFICDYDEVFRLNLMDKPNVEILDDNPFEYLANLQHSLGVNGGEAIHSFGENAIEYDFDPSSDFAIIKYSISGETGEIEFRILSGDLFAASFSSDGKYLVIAEPYAFDVYTIA